MGITFAAWRFHYRHLHLCTDDDLMKTTEIAVTDRRIVIKRGWIKRSTEELSLSSVEEVNVKQASGGAYLVLAN